MLRCLIAVACSLWVTCSFGQTSPASISPGTPVQIVCGSESTEVVLHGTASAALPVVEILSCGDRLTVVAKQAEWYKVRTQEGKEGYVRDVFLAATSAVEQASGQARDGYIDCNPGATATGLLESPGASGRTITMMRCGEKITVLEESPRENEELDKVETSVGNVGYVRRSFVSSNPPSAVSAGSPQQSPQPTYSRAIPPTPTSAADDGCQKNISFAIVEGGQIFPAVPNFAAKWTSNNKHLAKHPGFCFSQTPNPHARNFLIVFSNSASSFLGLYPTVRTNTTTSPVYGSGTVTDNYGGMWNYTYSGTVTTTTTTTENIPYVDTSRTLYAHAYSQQGSLVSNRWATVTTRQGGDPYNSLGYNLGSALGSIHLKERLLESVIRDIH